MWKIYSIINCVSVCVQRRRQIIIEINSRLFSILVHAIVLFTAFPVHECAHAWTAEKLGDDTARKAGRITLNPLKHLSLMGTLMMLFVGFGWAEPVPVDPRKFKNPKNGMAFTAIAGPLSNLIMAFVAMVVFRVLYAIAYYKNLSIDTVLDIFWLITYLNIGLAVFNLLPIPPLDGSRIFNLVMPEEIYFKVMKYERYVFVALLLLLYTGLLDKPLTALRTGAMNVMIFLTDWVDIITGMICG